MIMIIEGTTAYEFHTDPEKCWRLLDAGDSAEIIRISCDNIFTILKSELVYNHADRGKAVYRDRVIILKVGVRK